MKCRDPEHKFFGNYQQRLEETKLVEANGYIRPEVRDVVLSAVTGDGLEMKLSSPLAEQQAEKPKLPGVPMDSEELRTYFAKVYNIAQHIVDLNKQRDDAQAAESGRKGFAEGVLKLEQNPFYDRIEFNGGVALRCYYGRPYSFYTPLGEVRITTYMSSPGEALIDQLKDKLGLEVAFPKVNDQMGTHGPVYYITKDMDGNPLPKADLTGFNGFFMGNYAPLPDDQYNIANNLWKAVLQNAKEQPTRTQGKQSPVASNDSISGGPAS